MRPQAVHNHELLIIPAVTGVNVSPSTVRMDVKFHTGNIKLQHYWGGPMRVVMLEGETNQLFSGGALYERSDIPYEVAFSTVDDLPSHLAGADVLLTNADLHHLLPLPHQAQQQNIPCVSIYEYTLETRLQINMVAKESLLRRLKGALWNLRMEPVRRASLRASTGVQFNGTPASDNYGAITSNSIVFFDTRLSETNQGTIEEMTNRAERINAGAPLQIAFSGRFEPMKGSDQLIPMAAALKNAQCNAHLHLFGEGSLDEQMREEVATLDLHDYVTFHGSIRFEDELVPFLRQNIDLFTCPHPQSDPSCTYLETFGCGIPIIGTQNDAFAGLMRRADAGWLVPLGKPNAMAERVIALDQDRSAIHPKAAAALAFARDNSFEKTMARRADHLQSILAVNASP